MYRKESISSVLIGIMVLLFAAVNLPAQIAAGGNYRLEQATIANGGGSSSGVGYAISGTSGQNAVGADPGGGIYAVRNGFWTGLLAPTAAGVSISGRVLGPAGEGLRNVRVVLNGGPLTSPRTVLTNSFGNFSFEGVGAGEFYVVTVVSKRYGFGQPSQSAWVTENITDMIFTSAWEN